MTVSQAAFDALKARCDKLEKFMGVTFLEGEETLAKYGTRQLSQLTRAQFAELTIPANELPNGEYNFALWQALQNRIDADQGEFLGEHEGEIDTLEARPSGSVSAPPPGSGSLTAADLNAVLNQFDMYIEKDPETGRSILSMGKTPDFDCQSPLQIGGKFAAEIAGYSDTMRIEGQGSGSHDSCNTLVIADGDGGMRLRQYLKWGKRGKLRNTLSRPATITAMDSVGELCQSQEPIGGNTDGGQNWYVKTDWARKLVRFVTFKPGWKPTIEACSTNYADADIKLL